MSADEQLLELARQVARSQRKTLNQAFREWLQAYARPDDGLAAYEALTKDLGSGLAASSRAKR